MMINGLGLNDWTRALVAARWLTGERDINFFQSSFGGSCLTCVFWLLRLRLPITTDSASDELAAAGESCFVDVGNEFWSVGFDCCTCRLVHECSCICKNDDSSSGCQN